MGFVKVVEGSQAWCTGFPPPRSSSSSPELITHAPGYTRVLPEVNTQSASSQYRGDTRVFQNARLEGAHFTDVTYEKAVISISEVTCDRDSVLSEFSRTLMSATSLFKFVNNLRDSRLRRQ